MPVSPGPITLNIAPATISPLGSKVTTARDVLAEQWSAQLRAWAIPEEILRQAPESPWGFPPELFRHSAEVALRGDGSVPSRRRALEALAGGGSVLDVGAGMGAASLPLAPPAERIVGVDESASMLDGFRRLAEERSVPHATVAGRWPDVAGEVEAADVVVCHHVLYNVAELVPFVEALASHARRRVVVEITAEHPQAELNQLWRELHGIERPDGPTADDAVALLRAMGLPVEEERFSRPALWADADLEHRIVFARRRLCVGPERDADIARLLPSGDRRLVTVWWDGGDLRL